MRVIILPTYKDWLEWRFNGIGASDAPSVMNASPFMTREELWAKKTERLLSKKSTPQMKRGKDLEELARREYEKMTGIEMAPAFIEHDEIPFAIASLDGMNIKASRALEIKCPGKVDHGTALKGQIPHKYIWQCVHILMVTGLSELDYFSFDGESGVIINFKRNFEMENRLLKAETIFWEHVLKDIAPEKPKENVVSFQEKIRLLRSKDEK